MWLDELEGGSFAKLKKGRQNEPEKDEEVMITVTSKRATRDSDNIGSGQSCKW